MIPITPPPREAVQVHVAPGLLQPHQAFGGPIPTQPSPIETIAVKDRTLQRPVPKEDGAKFVPNNSSSGLLFRGNNSPATSTTFDSTESPTLFKTPYLVSNTTVFPSPLFGNNTTTHNNTPMMDSPFNDPSTSLDFDSGTFTHQPRPNTSDSDLAMKQTFEEYLVDNLDDDNSFLFTPHTNETSFTHSSLTSGLDTPSMDLAEIDSYLNSTSFGEHDFNLFGDKGLKSEEWNPLFNPASLAEDPIAPYAYFKYTAATVTSASPQQFSFSSIGDSSKPDALPSPELSPPTTRKPVVRRPTLAKPASAARRVSTTPFTPITPAPTTPSTPQPVISRATKRRIPVIGEDPSVIEKRRRNTIAAQRSRLRKAEEKAEDRARITQLEKETENLRLLLSYWKDRACELGASPLEDGEN
jgi:hypothetical protein